MFFPVRSAVEGRRWTVSCVLSAACCVAVTIPQIATAQDVKTHNATPPAHGSLSRVGSELRWNGKPVHLVGHSYYGLLGDEDFDADGYLDALAAHNVNFTRFFLMLPWPVHEDGRPNLLPFHRENGKYDLRRFDEKCWRRLEHIVARAESLGIICQVCAFDRCGLSRGDRRAWPNNPYNAAINANGLFEDGQRGYPPFCVLDGAAAEINAAVLRKTVETLAAHGNVIYEIINEPYAELGPLRPWHAWASGVLREEFDRRGVRSPVVASTGWHADAVDLFSMHMAGSDRHVAAALAQSRQIERPLILSDDGDMNCMFNPDVTRASLRRALEEGQHFEHLEYSLALQREEEHRRASRLDEMSALAQINLRALAERGQPLVSRPVVRGSTIAVDGDGQRRLTARIERAELAAAATVEYSHDGGRTWRPISSDRADDRVTSSPLPVAEAARCLARVVCTDGSGRRWPGPSMYYGPLVAASLRVAEDGRLIEAGLARIRPRHGDGVMRFASVNGAACLELEPKRRGDYAYFRCEDEALRGAKANRDAVVTVRFLDRSPSARLVVEYNGSSGPYTSAAPVATKGENAWREVAIALSGFRPQGKQNDGADFRLRLDGDPLPLVLREVRLRFDGPVRGDALRDE
ncbi:MAG: hypothetical protein WD875_14940 [Pirellulales bacterium]